MFQNRCDLRLCVRAPGGFTMATATKWLALTSLGGPRGALRAVLGSNSAAVVFECSEHDARRMEAAYEDAPPVFDAASLTMPAAAERVESWTRQSTHSWMSTSVATRS